jgi:chromosome condensin MukBEF ATPase and DNA-binding subunit MukB
MVLINSFKNIDEQTGIKSQTKKTYPFMISSCYLSQKSKKINSFDINFQCSSMILVFQPQPDQEFDKINQEKNRANRQVELKSNERQIQMLKIPLDQ